QTPPAYSACKVDGRRAYAIARKGDDPGLKPKVLVIDEITLEKYSPESITVRVVCSKGTYIRALARDIGAALGSGGYLTALRRERVGESDIADCMTVDEAEHFIRTAPMEILSEEGATVQVPQLPPRPVTESTLSRADILPWNLRPGNGPEAAFRGE
ncbi:MAG: hypothetical protein K2I51_06540, partial [Muribaculaceae bacterium]|nr:hypothetical protein [Muribaculaceae bacterium]